jgi:DnaK suppressor protein
MAARSGKKETKATTTRVKKTATKVASKAEASQKKTMKKEKTKEKIKENQAPELSQKKSKKKSGSGDRHASLKEILLAKREALIQEIKQQLGQSVTEEQQRRLEAAMDSGDQALVDLEREMGISLQEMRNRERQLIDDALDSLDEGTYGMCADCGDEISEKRLHALPFARLCVECQSKRELMEKIERSEQRS